MREALKKVRSIVTHPGKAHADEVTGICLLLSELGEQITVSRREPTQKDLDDPRVLVLDVGMRHEPEKNNYDHHQDQASPSSIRLAARILGVDEMLARAYPWYLITDEMDRVGPRNVAKELGVDVDVVHKLNSGVASAFIEVFSEYKGAVDPDLCSVMARMGRRIIDRAQNYAREMDGRLGALPIHQVGDMKVLLDLDGKSSSALGSFCKEKGIVAVISLSNRSSGLKITRTDDVLLDFRLAKDVPYFEFVHANGFVATTNHVLPSDPAALLALAKSVADEVIPKACVSEVVIDPKQAAVVVTNGVGKEAGSPTLQN